MPYGEINLVPLFTQTLFKPCKCSKKKSRKQSYQTLPRKSNSVSKKLSQAFSLKRCSILNKWSKRFSVKVSGMCILPTIGDTQPNGTKNQKDATRTQKKTFTRPAKQKFFVSFAMVDCWKNNSEKNEFCGVLKKNEPDMIKQNPK